MMTENTRLSVKQLSAEDNPSLPARFRAKVAERPSNPPAQAVARG